MTLAFNEDVFRSVKFAGALRMQKAAAHLRRECERRAPKVVREDFADTVIVGDDYVEGRVSNDNWLARFLELGGKTKAHLIRSSNPPWALHFFWRKSWRFYKQVHHPGSRFRPRAFMRGALDGSRATIRAMLGGG